MIDNDKYRYLDETIKSLKDKYYCANVVYEWYNKITDTYYIGSTGHPYKRFQNHLFSKEKDKFHTDINKYGLDNFDYNIIDICDTRKDAYVSELLYIKEYFKNGKQLYNNNLISTLIDEE